MSKLEILTFLHILGAFLIVAGASIGAATGIAMTRTTSVRAIGLLARISRQAELMAIVPGALIAIVFGTWLVVDLDAYDFNEPWISAAYVLWFVAIGLGTGVLGPLMRRIDERADQLQAEGVETSEELRTLASAPRGAITGAALHVIIVVFLYLMVFKPGA